MTQVAKTRNYNNAIWAIDQPDEQRTRDALNAVGVDNINWTPAVYSKYSLVTRAVIATNFKAVKMLLEEFRADVNQVDDDGWSPLMVAAFNGLGEMTEVLLQHGADRLVKSTREYAFYPAGTTVSDIAASDIADREGFEMVRALLLPPPAAPVAPPMASS